MGLAHSFLAAFTLLALGLGGISGASAGEKADRDSRAAILGRQKIREELSAATAKGYLTRMDQYHLLLHAKEVLSTEDFQGFEKTLDRIANQQAKANSPVHRIGTGAGVPASAANCGVSRQQDASQVMPSRYDQTATPADTVMPATDSGAASGGSPFVEEVPPGNAQPSVEPMPQGSMQQAMGGCDSDCCEDECEEGRPRRHWVSLDMFSGVEAFKGPLDVGNANGNFGARVGINGAVPLLRRLGVGLQAGLAADFSNLKGSPYPFPNATIRDQVFTTVGMFQRIDRCDGSAFTWGFAYDWLFDDYYSSFHFGQWRVKGEYEFSPWDAFGAEASLPEHGSDGALPNFEGGTDILHFSPITQGNFYWSHSFCNNATLTGRLGIAERPNNFLFGADGRVPLTQSMALTGGFTYIMPNVGAGPEGQTQEIWNVSVGIEIIPGGFCRCGAARFRPFLPVADNSSLAVKEVP